MWVKSLELQDVRSFKGNQHLAFSKGINIIVGRNNSGKSTIVEALHGLQINYHPLKRVGAADAFVAMDLQDVDSTIGYFVHLRGMTEATVTLSASKQPLVRYNTTNSGFSYYEPSISNHFIYPFLSKRKPEKYIYEINSANAQKIEKDLSLLYPQVDSILSDPEDEANPAFVASCERILGFRLSPLLVGGGKSIGLKTTSKEEIHLANMGEGVPQIIGLISQLVRASGKLFLIEEIENDLHPEALKELLSIVVEKSKTNQFIISTHSHVVLKYLGAEPDSRVFHLTLSYEEKIPTTSVRTIEAGDVQGRRDILQDLGYELFDFDLAGGWLFLEESSAERIIKDYLIPQYVPSLSSLLRTVSTGGVGNVPRFVADFSRLFLFVHREEVYRNRAWVLVDGDEAGKAVVEKLKTFNGWNHVQFQMFTQSNFEQYYPVRFSAAAQIALAEADEKLRADKKRDLLYEVLEWIKSNPDDAKTEFATSAVEVIEHLRSIEAVLIPRKHTSLSDAVTAEANSAPAVASAEV